MISKDRDLVKLKYASMAAMVVCAVAATTAWGTPAAQAQTSSPQVTFSKDVAPILYTNCVRCHQPDEVAPMSLLTYKDAKPYAQMMKKRVSARTMPPWFLDKNIGIQKYKNNPSLSDAEVATIVKWVDEGAPEGNPADLPAKPAADDVNAWSIGKPDLIVDYPEYNMPATGPDQYGALEVPFGLKTDRYIMAMQSKVADSQSRLVVHHALSYAVAAQHDDGQMGDDSGGGMGQFLVEYASGKNATFYDNDEGALLQANQVARAEYHFHSVGHPVKVHLQLGIKFYPEGFVPKHIEWSKQLGQDAANDIDIQPGKIFRRDGYTLLTHAAMITAWQPHMHIRGSYQCLELIYPVSPVKTETVTCASWNYNWHTIYNYQDDVQPIVPAGTILHVISWYDNTDKNSYNPDPNNEVTAATGRTIDEMGFSWIGWYDLSDAEYKADIAARKAKRMGAQGEGETTAALNTATPTAAAQ